MSQKLNSLLKEEEIKLADKLCVNSSAYLLTSY